MKTNIENRKYYKYDKIYIYQKKGTGKNTYYENAILGADMQLYRYAQSLQFLKITNDAPRGEKYGEHFEVCKYFSHRRLLDKMLAEKRKLDRQLKKVIQSEYVDSFDTFSDIGSFIIDDVKYSNFYGDGTNRVEIVKIDDVDEFQNAEYITRRQIYNPKMPINIIKFPKTKSITVSKYYSSDKYGIQIIENVIGFIIWERKLKIFTV